jgi:hypothetical protein
MGLNTIGLLCDFLGFSFISIGAWQELNRRKVKWISKKIIKMPRNDIQHKKFGEAIYELSNYKKDRDEKKEYLNKKKEDDIELRESFSHDTKDFQYYVAMFTDGAEFDPEEFENETKSELESQKEKLNELIKTINYKEESKEEEEEEKVIASYITGFKKTIVHLNEQMFFLKIGTVLVLLGFLLQFINSY